MGRDLRAERLADVVVKTHGWDSPLRARKPTFRATPMTSAIAQKRKLVRRTECVYQHSCFSCDLITRQPYNLVLLFDGSRAVLRILRGLCLVSLCVLGIALIVAIFELALPAAVNTTGCHANFEILPNFTCEEGLVSRLIETILNLPLLFVYAPAFTLSATLAPLSREFRLVLYFFDVILVLALTYPPLLFLERRRGRQHG
jgi:hypothetical protein